MIITRRVLNSREHGRGGIEKTRLNIDNALAAC